MKLKNLLKIFLATVITFNSIQAQTTFRCLQEFTINALGEEDEIFACVGAEIQDVLELRSSSYATPIGYLVVNEEDIIVKFSLRSFLSVDDLPEGNFRIYGFSFLGTPTLTTGMPLSETKLANICYELSDNFIRLFNVDPDGETVSTASGLSSLFVCTLDGNPDPITFATTSTDPNYAYFVTDQEGTIEHIVEGNTFDFDDQAFGTSNVWGISYVGDLNATIGQSVFDENLASQCFDISDNFVEIIKTQPEGGQVSLTTGETSTVVCTGDGEDDILSFGVSGNSNAPFNFILTDSINNVLLVLSQNSLNFDFLAPGSCRIWGVSYTDTLAIQIGVDLLEQQLSEDCFDLSDNFVEIIKKNPTGGTVSLEQGTADAVFCINDDNPDLINLFNTGGDNESYAYLITDTNNQLIEVISSDQTDLEGTPGGTYRIWGLGFTGNFTASAGENIFEALLSDECFELSDNFITYTSIFIDPGSIALSTGSVDTTLCFGDPQSDILSFNYSTTTAEETQIRYVLTDEQDSILLLTDNATIDFSGLSTGVCRLYGLSYTGELLAEEGANAQDVLSTECYDLSENFVTINHVFVEGGSISLIDGSADQVLCVQDGSPDVLTFQANDAVEDQYVFLVADLDGFITDIIISDTYDFDNSTGGEAQVIGVSFSGTFLAQVGDNINATVLASECYDLSDNSISIEKKLLEAGSISLPSGNQDTVLCFGDPTADMLFFNVSGFNGVGEYRYILTDERDLILAIIETPMFDFRRVNRPNCKVYGLSYTGELLARLGDDINNIALSTECADLTDDVINIKHVSVEGGVVNLEEGGERAVVCVQDGNPDVFNFVAIGGAIVDQYVYIVTDENGIITNVLEGSSFDFESMDEGIARVFGVSYSGELTAQIGEDIETTSLSTECFDISNNAINFTKKLLEAGNISLSSGRQDTTLCFGDPQADMLSFLVDGFNNVGEFRFILTDDENNILDIFLLPSLNFENITDDNCRVWGLSYTGDLLLNVGGNLDADVVSTECYDLSDSFVGIQHVFVEGGSVSLADTSMNVTLCVQDGVEDLIAFQANDAITDRYLFLITDENENITQILSESNFNFDNEAAGTCFVFGVSFSGNFTAQVGDNIRSAALSNECFDLSTNAIEITKKQLEAGDIFLESGQQDTFLCFGDSNADLLNFTITGFNETGTYRYILTDRQNTVLGIFEDPSIAFSEVREDQCRVYGLSFTGNLLLEVGDRLTSSVIADECYDLSDNFVTIEHVFVDGGEVNFGPNSAGPVICSADGIPDIVLVNNTSTSLSTYQYILTDGDNRVILLMEGSSINLDIANAGTCRIWGLSYTGDLNIRIGQILTDGALSNQCFDLSSTFVEIEKKDLLPGLVTSTSGETIVDVCAGEDVTDRVTFTNTSPQPDESYVYVVTDELNNILSISADSNILFSNILIETCRVWGVIYSGNLLLQTGDPILGTVISDECFEVSENFVTVRHNIVDGGRVTLSDGTVLKNICVRDGVPDPLELNTSSTSNENYTYLLTNERNQLLTVLNSNSIDLDGSVGGIVHLYGLSYTGDITVQFGQIVTQAQLSSECFDLSENFVSIDKIDLESGTVSLINGLQNTFVCFGDGVADRLQFTNDAPPATNYAYLLTDQANNLIKMSISPEFGIDEQNIPGARVYGLAYTGNLITSATGNIFNAVLSTECTEITSNFVDITYFFLDGGQLSTSTGETSIFVCGQDGTPDIISFQNDGEGTGDYTYVLTDENNQILLQLESNSINLDIAAPGVCKIWGISFAGNLNLPIGSNILTDQFASDCFDISDNAITIRKEEVVGGALSFNDGSDLIYTCPADGNADVLTFNTSGTTTSAYIYLITDAAGNLITFANGTTFDFETLDNDACRVYGMAFSGQLSIAPGDNINSSSLSNECASLSSNFLTVIKESPSAGPITTDSGNGLFDFCAQDGNPNLIQLDSSTTFTGPFAYLLTDNNGELRYRLSSDQIDFDTLAAGRYRIYGVAYTGLFVGIEGSLVEEEILSDDCFILSDNFIEIINDTPNAGAIATGDKETLIYVCPDDNNPSVVDFFTEDQSINSFVYAITDEENVVLEFLDGNQYDFDNPLPIFTRVWGISYSGNLLAQVGTDLDGATLSDDCFDLSDNFVSVVRDVPQGGTLSTDSGATSFRVCVNDGTSDLINFSTTEDSEARYVLLITDGNNVLIDTLERFSLDFEFTGEGINRIWGLSYTGNFNFAVGEDIQRTFLSDDCFELSTNFIEITKTQVDGGDINTAFNSDTIYVCPDGVDDIISFTNNSMALGGEYTYALTRPNGLILAYLDGNSRNFDNTGITELQVWGISYTGNFNDNVARGRIDEVAHSDSCFTLSNNFITIFLDVPDGGSISTADGATTTDFCVSPTQSNLSVTVDNNSSAGYALILTDQANQVISINTNGTVDMSIVERGTYRIYGLSYTGMLTVEPGELITNNSLSTSCFDISTNFITVNRLGDVDGGSISLIDGSTELYSCPGDEVADLAILSSTSSLQASNYRYIITDANNRIQIVDIQGEVIDFNPAPATVFRIWAVSFTGTLTPTVGRDITTAMLSSECYELSSNFITIFNEGAKGGTVSTEDGSTTATISLMDNATLPVMNQDGVGNMYSYIITDLNDNIIDATFESTVDFSALSVGNYRVYGLALNGNYTGMLNTNILSSMLSDACFEVSSNFIELSLIEGPIEFQSNDEDIKLERGEQGELALWPNPVRSSITVDWKSDTEGDIEFMIFNIFGQQVIAQMVQGGAKETNMAIDVTKLGAGIYMLVTVKDGKVMAKEKFMKSE